MKIQQEYENSLELTARKFSKVIDETFRKAHKEFGFKLSHEEFIILEIINSHSGIIPIEIASITMTQRSYVCKLLTKLKESGYITQEKGTRGKKQVILKNYLTQKGCEERNKIRSTLMKKFYERTTEETREEVIFLIRKLNELTNKMISDLNIKF